MKESCIPLTSVFKFDHTINNAFRDKSKGHKSKHYWFRYLLGQGLNNHNLTSLSPSIPREISQATMMAGSSRWQSAVIGGNGAWRTRMRTMNLKSNRTCLYRRSDRGPVLGFTAAWQSGGAAGATHVQISWISAWIPSEVTRTFFCDLPIWDSNSSSFSCRSFSSQREPTVVGSNIYTVVLNLSKNTL